MSYSQCEFHTIIGGIFSEILNSIIIFQDPEHSDKACTLKIKVEKETNLQDFKFMILEISSENSTETVQLTCRLACSVDISTNPKSFRLEHIDEFPQIEVTFFYFQKGYETEEIRFEQFMIKWCTFQEVKFRFWFK